MLDNMEDRLIERPLYMNKLLDYLDVPVIKVLTGVRRCGKSTLLEQLSQTIRDRHPEVTILSLNLESGIGLPIRTASQLYNYVAKVAPDKTARTYFFFDEIQRVSSWEDAINAIRVDWNCDIYLTGSNSSMLSGDLATNIAGRYVEIQVRPLIFREFKVLYSHLSLSDEELFKKFIIFGGYPMLKFFDFNESLSFEYLRNVFDSAVKRDVIEHYKIRDIDIFDRILDYCLENIGRTFSAGSLARFLKSEHRSASVDTVLNYLSYCEQAFLISRVPRYDLRGQQLLRSEEKYYAADLGLRAARSFSNSRDIELLLENIVFQELQARGFDVKVGRLSHGKNRQIDFVASREGLVEYFQVCYLLASEDTVRREFGALEDISDNFPKTVLSMDAINQSYNGIQHRNIVEWLSS